MVQFGPQKRTEQWGPNPLGSKSAGIQIRWGPNPLGSKSDVPLALIYTGFPRVLENLENPVIFILTFSRTGSPVIFILTFSRTGRS